jgi:hypothetical protein
MKEALQSTLYDVPYNSFAPFILHNKESVPPEMGGNCVRQNEVLSSKLLEKGYNPSYISCEIGKGNIHYASICFDGNELFYLDPFAFQKDPISLTKMFRTGREVVCDAYPVSNEKACKLALKPTGKSTFTVSLYRPNPNDSGKDRLAFCYSYDLRDRLEWLPQADSKIFIRRQKQLVLRVLRSSGQITDIRLHQQTGNLEIVKADGDMRLRRFRQNKPREAVSFHEELAEITKRLRVRVCDVFDTFYRGHEAYLQHFPLEG